MRDVCASALDVYAGELVKMGRHAEAAAVLRAWTMTTAQPLPTPTPLEAARERFTDAAIEMFDASRVGDDARYVTAFEFAQSGYDALRALESEGVGDA